MRSEHSNLNVDLGQRSYDIVSGEELLQHAGSLIYPLLASKRVILITDKNVKKYWLKTVEKSLNEAGIDFFCIVLDYGEQIKDFANVEVLTGQLLDAQVERSTTLIALGGGVVGDLVGFCAAITLRGLDFIQIPTTLLAQVDSSVGGKTGVNVSQGKNLLGAFHQPRLVLADISTLNTLPARDLRSGYAEIVKYGLIDNKDFFSWLEINGQGVIGIDVKADQKNRRHAILSSCKIKADIVSADETEKGNRALLNMGHTFGHALEAKAGYSGALTHGESISIGMSMAFDLSVRMGICPCEDRDRIKKHLELCGLPIGLNKLNVDSWSSSKLLDFMYQDKKVSGGKLTFILAHGIGKPIITNDINIDDLTAILNEYIKA
jgi:3-dehydroquinate synthase